MTKRSRLNRASALALALALAAIGFGATAVDTLAKRPGQGGSGAAETCSLTSAGVGQPLILSGSGFAANSQYIVYMTSPGGTGATTVNTDPTGSLAAGNFWTYWSGTYSVQLWSEGHQSNLAASCATSVA